MMPLSISERRRDAKRRWTNVQALWTGLILLLGASRADAQSVAPPPAPSAAPGYQDHRALTEELREIAAAHPALVRLSETALTRGKREIWSVELGSGSD